MNNAELKEYHTFRIKLAIYLTHARMSNIYKYKQIQCQKIFNLPLE